MSLNNSHETKKFFWHKTCFLQNFKCYNFCFTNFSPTCLLLPLYCIFIKLQIRYYQTSFLNIHKIFQNFHYSSLLSVYFQKNIVSMLVIFSLFHPQFLQQCFAAQNLYCCLLLIASALCVRLSIMLLDILCNTKFLKTQQAKSTPLATRTWPIRSTSARRR